MTPELPSPVALGVGYYDEHIFGHTKEQLIEYGKLVESATREECAKECEEWATSHANATGECDYNTCDMVAVAVELAEKIRSGI